MEGGLRTCAYSGTRFHHRGLCRGSAVRSSALTTGGLLLAIRQINGGAVVILVARLLNKLCLYPRCLTRQSGYMSLYIYLYQVEYRLVNLNVSNKRFLIYVRVMCYDST